MDLKAYFDKVWVVNMDRRRDRWDAFLSRLSRIDWPFRDPERWRATDGKITGNGPKWRGGFGAWGCLTSHMWMWDEAMHRNYKRVLFLEDDAVFVPDLATQAARHISQLPPDWEQWYPGGQVLKGFSQFSENLLLPNDVNRTHAYALQGEGFRKIYRWCTDLRDEWRADHVDHRMGQLHLTKGIKVFLSSPRLAGQAAGQSNIKGKVLKENWFISSAEKQKMGQEEKKGASVLVIHETPPPLPARPSPQKKVLIVGNGPSATIVGDQEAEFREIWRINNWVPSPEVGSRCDVWVRNPAADVKARDLSPFKRAYVIPGLARMPADLIFNRMRRSAPRSCVVEPVPMDWSLSIQKKYGFQEGEVASTGLLAVLWALEKEPVVHVAGFDHFAGPEIHYWGGGTRTGWHKPDREAEAFRTLEQEGRIVRLPGPSRPPSIPIQTTTPLDVVCVLFKPQVGPALPPISANVGYSPEWVNRLYRGFSRHLSLPFKFHCLTDVEGDFDSNISLHPFQNPTGDWWCINEVFRPDLPFGRVLVTGLDTIVRGSLDEIASWEGEFGMLRNIYLPSRRGNGVCLWDHGKVAERMWAAANDPQKKAACKLQTVNGFRLSEMILWEKEYPNSPLLTDIFPGQMVWYKGEWCKGQYLHREGWKDLDHSNVRMVYFSGRRKPPEIFNEEWGKTLEGDWV